MGSSLMCYDGERDADRGKLSGVVCIMEVF